MSRKHVLYRPTPLPALGGLDLGKYVFENLQTVADELHGIVQPQWDDMLGIGGGLQIPTVNPAVWDGDEIAWKFTTGNRWLYFSTQLSHQWYEGTELHPHVHLYTGATTGTSLWDVDYRLYSFGAAVPGVWTTLGTNVPWDAPGVSRTSAILDLGAISATAETVSCIIKLRLKLVSKTIATDIFVDAIDVHYMKDARGSYDEYTKQT